MRKAFVETLVELAQQDERIMLLTADLGFMVLEPFRNRFPDRFINVGVMEQNMMGLATGLAMNGFIPFAYSIATFATLRSYEFIRNGPLAHNLPVRIVGIGSGVDYAHDGLTHHAYEDIGILRTFPTINIVAPADSHQAKTALEKTWNMEGPIYYRLSKNDVIVPGLNGQFTPGSLDLIRQGKDCLLLSTGTISVDVMEAAQKLAGQGIEASVAVLSSIHSLSPNELRFLLSGYRHVFTYETHSYTGGIGSLVAETIADYNLGCKLNRNGLTYWPGETLGSQKFLHQRNKIDTESILETVKRQLGQ
jgi:transketolase